MRLRACQTYGLFSEDVFADEGHIQRVSEGVFKNMADDQPLPVRFYAACAFEKILRNDKAMKYIRQGLETMLKCYISLMNEFDNEELVAAFENIMTIFSDEIGPYAIDICTHLREAYKRCIQAEQEEDDDDFGEASLAAIGTVASIRRILVVLSDDAKAIRQAEDIIYPVLLHTMTADGLDSVEEGVDCIGLVVQHGYRQQSISEQMWKLYLQLLFICVGSEEEPDGGYGTEYVASVINALKSYVAADPKGLLRVLEGETKTSLQKLYFFIGKILKINRNGDEMDDGVHTFELIMALFENMQGLLDGDLPQIIDVLAKELEFVQQQGAKGKFLKGVLQAICMSFYYNAELTFQALVA